MATVDTVGIPWFRLFYRTQEHLIEAQGVGTILLDNHIRVDHIEHRFRHLFDGPSADVLTILENELSLLVFRTPSLESVNIQYIVGYDVDIHMDRSSLVFILQTEADEFTLVTPLLYSVNEIRATLNHTLVHQFLERLVFTAIAGVIEELVPETRINEVTCSMFRTTNIEVDIAPVLISITTDKCLLVLRVHIAQIVGTGTGEARHGVQFEWEDGFIVDK